jgi:hypothetical protein
VAIGFVGHKLESNACLSPFTFRLLFECVARLLFAFTRYAFRGGAISARVYAAFPPSARPTSEVCSHIPRTAPYLERKRWRVKFPRGILALEKPPE